MKTMFNNKNVHGLWIGNELSKMELLTIKSFIRQGHEFNLWLYDKMDTPNWNGLFIKNANEIIPQREVFKYDHNNSYAGFSDIFRFKLLYDVGGWWTDMDVTCLRHLNFEDEYVFKPHGLPGCLVANIIKCPKGSPLAKEYYEKGQQIITSKNKQWFLPLYLLTTLVYCHGLQKYIKTYEIFGPECIDSKINTFNAEMFGSECNATTYIIHWCNSFDLAIGTKQQKTDRGRKLFANLLYQHGIIKKTYI